MHYLPFSHYVWHTGILYCNDILKNVSSFTYYGVTLTSNGNFFQTQKALATQVNTAYLFCFFFLLNSIFKRYHLMLLKN